MSYLTPNIGLNRFPDELTDNENKKSFDFAQKYASAIWSEWENTYYTRQQKLNTLRKYAIGDHDISGCKKNITGEYTDLKYWEIDWNDKVNLLPVLLRNYLNSVDMDELQPVVKAIDPTAIGFKNKRKDDKLKMFLAKDFIEDMVSNGFADKQAQFDQIPQSREQLDLEEETAEPLKIEKAESLLFEYISRYDNFNIIQKEQLKEALVSNYLIGNISTCPIDGVKMRGVKLDNFVHGKTSNDYFSDCKYFGEVRKITVAQIKNIAKESGLLFSDDDIRKMVADSSLREINDSQEARALYYTFETFFEDKKVKREVFSKKANKKTGAIRLIDSKEYKPRNENDKPKEIVDNYTVWMEGIMVLSNEKTILRHRLMSNLAEDKKTGRIIPPYIAIKIRDKSIVEEVKPRIDAIQELRYRILHFRNTLKGTITELDPDMIANVTIGNEKLSPKEVLSMYFTKFIRFRNTVDEDGEPINRNTNISESDTPIPRALIQLANEFISEIQLLNQTFGAIQYDQANQDPKTLLEGEPYRLSNNASMRDYTNALYQWTIFCYQSVSSRINDAIQWKSVRDKLVSALGTDDIQVIEEFKKHRGNHYFGIYTDLVPAAEEKMKLARRLETYVLNGVLDPLDEMEITNTKNRVQQLAMLRLRIMAKQKQAEQSKMAEINAQQEGQINANTQSAVTSQEQKRITMQMEYELKERAAQADFERKAFLLQKEGEMKLQEEQMRGNAKIEAQRWSSQFTEDLTKFKKDADAKLRMDAINQSAYNQQQLVKLRKGEISDINQPTQENENIDLSFLNNGEEEI